MLVFDDIREASVKHASESKSRHRRGTRKRVPKGILEHAGEVISLMETAPAEMAQATEHFLSVTGQLAEHARIVPALASEQAAEAIKLLAHSKTVDTPAEGGEDDDKVKLGSPFLGTLSSSDMASTLIELSMRLLARPDVLISEACQALRNLGQSLAGGAPCKPRKGDRRYDDAAWSDNPFYRLNLQTYLNWTGTVERLVARSGASEADRQRIRYVTSLITDALSPDNTLPGNPAAMKRFMETGGASLIDGGRNLLKDIAANRRSPAQVDVSAFEVGRNVAATPGAVVYRNDVLELIQYKPVTSEVHAIPVMLVPAVVNKYYVMDLSPGHSLVEFLVAQGFQPFMLSWRNPRPEHSGWTLDRYVEAMVQALEVITNITGSSTVNTFTTCTGAVPLGALLAYISRSQPGRIASATMVVSVLDSNRGRSLGLFATQQSINEAKRHSASKGVLTGEEMAEVFTWMRPRDLVWNYWVNNYLMGRTPPALDVLFWNNDPMRLAAGMHADLLDVFSRDLLTRQGGMSILGEHVDLSDVKCDRYVVGGLTDHISVWKGVYESAHRFGGQFQFVLHSSGHIQSVITNPGTPKAKHWVNPLTPASPEEWLEMAEIREDSWWLHWRGWLADRSGEMKTAPNELGSSLHPALDKAPGHYVREP